MMSNREYPHSTNTATTMRLRFDTFAAYLRVLLLFHNSSAMCFLGIALKQCEVCFDILKLWKETDMCRDGWDFVWIIDTPGPSWHQKRSIKTPPRLNRTPPPPPLTTRPTARALRRRRSRKKNIKSTKNAKKAPKGWRQHQMAIIDATWHLWDDAKSGCILWKALKS